MIPRTESTAKETARTVVCVVGTRPEAIKMAPVILALRNVPEFSVYTLATGQHTDMLDQALAHFRIEPEYNLRVMREKQSLDYITARVLEESGNVFDHVRPSMVLVHGDTTTTLSAALAAFYRKIPIAHVEAGLRSGRLDLPFPEEANRILTDRISRLLFAPTDGARDNLIREGISEDSITVTGNTVIDALSWTIGEYGDSGHLENFDFARNVRFVIFTAHRRESWGEPLVGMCIAVRRLLERYPDLSVLIPLHKNPSVRNRIQKELGEHSRVVYSEPLDYASFVFAMRHCALILSDSGGIQEEAAALGKPVLVLRDVSERPEAMTEGTAILVGTSTDAIVKNAERILSTLPVRKNIQDSIRPNPFGDGRAACRISEGISKYFNDRS